MASRETSKAQAERAEGSFVEFEDLSELIDQVSTGEPNDPPPPPVSFLVETATFIGPYVTVEFISDEDLTVLGGNGVDSSRDVALGLLIALASLTQMSYDTYCSIGELIDEKFPEEGE